MNRPTVHPCARPAPADWTSRLTPPISRTQVTGWLQGPRIRACANARLSPCGPAHTKPAHTKPGSQTVLVQDRFVDQDTGPIPVVSTIWLPPVESRPRCSLADEGPRPIISDSSARPTLVNSVSRSALVDPEHQASSPSDPGTRPALPKTPAAWDTTRSPPRNSWGTDWGRTFLEKPVWKIRIGTQFLKITDTNASP